MARRFDGATGLVLSTSLLQAARVTVSVWLRLRSIPGSAYFVAGFDQISDTAHDKVFFVDSSSKVGWYCYDGGIQTVLSTQSVVPGQWYHLLGTADGTTSSFYINGILEGSTPCGDTYTGYTDPNIHVGQGDAVPGSGFTYFLDGDVAELAIWTQGITAAQAKTIYSGVPPGEVAPESLSLWWPLDGRGNVEPDLWGEANHGIVTGATWQSEFTALAQVRSAGFSVGLNISTDLSVPFLTTSTSLYPPELATVLDVPFFATATGLWPPVIYAGEIPPVAPPSLPIAPPTGYTFATAALGCVVFIAATPGPAGNLITIAYVVAGTNTPLSMSVSGSAVTINLATDGSGNPISTAGDVIGLVNSDSETTSLLAQEWDLLNASPEIVAWRAANPAEAAAIDAYRAQTGPEPAGIDDVSDALISITTAWLISELVTASLAPGCTMDDVLIALVPTPLDGGGSPGDPPGGGIGAPPGSGMGGPRFYQSPPWRWVVVDLAQSPFTTYTFLDHLADDVNFAFLLNQPWPWSCTVPSDDPEVNILADEPDPMEPFVTEGRRIVIGFRREGGSPRWVNRCNFIVDGIEDVGLTEVARTRITGHDIWQYLYKRPVCGPDGDLPGPNGFSFSNTRASTIARDYLENSIANMGDCWLDVSSGDFEPTVPLASYNIQQGESVGELLANLCATGTIDIIFTPLWDPVGNPGIAWVLNVYSRAGEDKPDAIMAWDKAGRNLSQISRLIDGSARANVVQFYHGQGGPPVPRQTDPDSVDLYREYWAQQFFPFQNVEAAVTSLAQATLQLRSLGMTTVTVSPTPERMPFLFTEFFLGDTIPVWASRNQGIANSGGTLRATLQGYQRVYGIPIRIDSGGLERIDRLLCSANEGVSS